jgi:hypothetical protein
MTAAAYKHDRSHIKESLDLHNCFELVANSDRSLRKDSDLQALILILMPWRTFAEQLML